MEKFKDIVQIFDFAIKREEEAYNFYNELTGKQDNPAIKELFTGFAKEEMGHKKRLEEAKKGNLAVFPVKKIQNLNIADYMLETVPGSNLSYQDTLVLAMQKEKKSFLLYTHLAEITTDNTTKNLFHILAQEEAGHKLRFEIEYDNLLAKDN